MNDFSPLARIALAIGVVCVLAFAFVEAAMAAPCAPNAPGGDVVYVNPESEEPSWIFRRSTYSHDPETGARVAQYMRTPPVEPLEDERLVTSRYRRSRTNLRGADGSVDTYYEVQAWGNGRGGIDAEWERFHDAWKESYLQGGFYNQSPAWGGPWNGGPWHGGGPGFGVGFGFPGHGFPGQGFPGHGGRWGHGGGHFPGGGHSGGHGGGHHGGGHHGGGDHGDEHDGDHGDD
jgi:hypothetical protein